MGFWDTLTGAIGGSSGPSVNEITAQAAANRAPATRPQATLGQAFTAPLANQSSVSSITQQAASNRQASAAASVAYQSRPMAYAVDPAGTFVDGYGGYDASQNAGRVATFYGTPARPAAPNVPDRTAVAQVSGGYIYEGTQYGGVAYSSGAVQRPSQPLWNDEAPRPFADTAAAVVDDVANVLSRVLPRDVIAGPPQAIEGATAPAGGGGFMDTYLPWLAGGLVFVGVLLMLRK